MVTITSVEARGIRLALEREIAFSTRRVQARFYTLVRVRCSDGSHGIGFCHSGTQGAALTSAAVREYLAPRLIGQDPHRTEGLWAELYQETLLMGRAGAVMRGLSALDTALWDRNAHAAGLPLWRYLGAYSSGTVSAYASGGYYFPGRGADWVEEELTAHLARGFTVAKIKIGGASPSVDAERVRVAREVLGPDGVLLLDANNAWNDFATAMRYLEPVLEYRPFFIEEPFGPEDYANHERLAAALPVAIATGEILGGRFAQQQIMEHGVTVLQPDAGVCGGPTEWRRIAAAAAAKGLSVAPHSLHHLHIHLVASVPNALFVEYFPDETILPLPRIIDTAIEVRDGALVLPTTPGLGWGFDERKVEENAVDGWA